ncbi:hypothetical protein [Paeniglutamicibacter sp. NPDC091659]
MLVADSAGNQIIVSKGSPEDVMRLCVEVPLRCTGPPG